MVGVLIMLTISVLICCVIAYIMALFWFSDVGNRRLRSFFGLGAEIFSWTLLNALSAVVREEYFPFVYSMRMVMVCIVPFGVLWFILDFTDFPVRTKTPVRGLLVFLAASDVAAVLTNPLHHMYFSDYSSPMPARAPLFWVHIALAMAVVAIAFAVLIRYVIKEAKNNPLLVVTVFALLIPYSINMLYTFRLVPLAFDVTPIGFFATILLFVLFAHRSQFFNIRTALFSSAMDSIVDIIVIFNKNFTVVDANRSALAAFEKFPLSPGRMKADGFFRQLDASAVKASPPDLFDTMRKGIDTDGEYSVGLPGGESRTYTSNFRAVYKGRKKTGFVLVSTDVTDFRDQYLLLEAVNHSASYLLNTDAENFERNLFYAMDEVGSSVRVDRVYVWKNHTIDGALHCTQVHEWSKGAEPQQGLDITISVPYGDDTMPGWYETLSNNRCINNIVRNMSPEEQEQLSQQGIISILVAPVFIKNSFWGFVGFDDCRSERVFTKVEEAILRSASLLFAHAYHRNEMYIALMDTSTQLETALVQASAASRAKGEFLSNMSHEMRTPLNTIIGMTTIGKKAPIEKKDHSLNKIGDAASHLLGLVNDVLDMAKIEADKLELAPVEYDLEDMLQKMTAVNSYKIDEKRLRFSMEVKDDVPRFLVGDDRRLAQVITNLLSNAVKFTPEGGHISLEVALAGESDEGCELRFEVADSGIGISREQQGRIFAAFEQAESGTSRKYGGTGLGLVISKRIVELMGGRLWVESELGKGARFIFTVKAKRSAAKTRPAAPTGAEAEKKGDGEFLGKRMLLVEDIEINREMLKALLEHTKIAIDCAENGKKALAIMEANPHKYDVVMMDIQMPEMDGLEATRRIRALPSGAASGLPIIAMTANVFKDDIEACLAAGMDDHLGKPFDIEKVLEKLRIYILP